jgi:hypothetical protein
MRRRFDPKSDTAATGEWLIGQWCWQRLDMNSGHQSWANRSGDSLSPEIEFRPSGDKLTPLRSWFIEQAICPRHFSWLLAMVLILSGCVSPGNDGNRTAPVFDPSGATIDELNLLAVPVALNFDNLPGLDGFVIKVYAGNRNRPKPVPIEAGKLELLMYDGILQRSDHGPISALRVWNFASDQLRRYQVKTSIGTGYELKLEWAEAKPKMDRITVLARYLPPAGKVIYSAPSVISVAGK